MHTHKHTRFLWPSSLFPHWYRSEACHKAQVLQGTRPSLTSSAHFRSFAACRADKMTVVPHLTPTQHLLPLLLLLNTLLPGLPCPHLLCQPTQSSVLQLSRRCNYLLKTQNPSCQLLSKTGNIKRISFISFKKKKKSFCFQQPPQSRVLGYLG